MTYLKVSKYLLSRWVMRPAGSLFLLLAMPLAHVRASSLKQRYYALRHGQSLANIERVISSDPQVASLHHGLSEKGWIEAQAAAAAIVEEAVAAGCGVAICSSDFRRARQTALTVRAGAVAAGLRVWPENGIQEEIGLRERYFGDFDAQRDTEYERVWAEDAKDPKHTIFNVESVCSVLDRAYAVVQKVDSQLDSQPWYAAVMTTQICVSVPD